MLYDVGSLADLSSIHLAVPVGQGSSASAEGWESFGKFDRPLRAAPPPDAATALPARTPACECRATCLAPAGQHAPPISRPPSPTIEARLPHSARRTHLPAPLSPPCSPDRPCSPPPPRCALPPVGRWIRPDGPTPILTAHPPRPRRQANVRRPAPRPPRACPLRLLCRQEPDRTWCSTGPTRGLGPESHPHQRQEREARCPPHSCQGDRNPALRTRIGRAAGITMSLGPIQAVVIRRRCKAA